MNRVSPILILGTVVLCGCPTRLKYPADGSAADRGAEGRVEASDAGGADAKIADADAGDDSGDTGGFVPPTLVITSPANDTHTNASVSVTVAVDQGATPPDQIALLENGTMITALSPPFDYSWDTTKVAEGTYSLIAEATVAGTVVSSAPVTVIVDRTPPTVTVTPSTGATNVVFASPMQKPYFPEAILATTLPATAVSVSIGATAIPTDLALSADGQTATITIKDRSTIVLPATLSAVFAATITDLAGNKLTPPSPAWSWTVPDWIKTQTFPSDGQVVLAVAPDSHPLVVYSILTVMSNGNYVYNVQVARHDSVKCGIQLGPPTTDVDTGRKGYSIDVDAQSHPTVAWAHLDWRWPVHLHVGSHDGTGWSTLPGWSTNPRASLTSPMTPKVRVDSDRTSRRRLALGDTAAVARNRGHFSLRAGPEPFWDKVVRRALGLNTGSALFGLDLVSSISRGMPSSAGRARSAPVSQSGEEPAGRGSPDVKWVKPLCHR